MIRFFLFASIFTGSVSAFLASTKSPIIYRSSTETFLFDKLFEEEGQLGKGITVGKVQVCLRCPNRSATSIFNLLEDHAELNSNANEDLAKMANEVCLDLLRKSDDWVSACSSSKWFSGNDASKAERYYNELSGDVATRFEKEYYPADFEEEGGPTLVVVSIVLEIQGDSTKFDGAGYSFAQTKEVLTSIASDCLVDDGYCINAVEALWTPSEPKEVLSKNDIVIDFPELIDL